MPSIVYSREVPLAAQALHQAFAGVLETIASKSRNDGVALTARLGGAMSKVSVPVEIEITKRSAKDSSVDLTIKARSATALFPKFKGTVHALSMSPSRTNLRFKGTYRVPFGRIGAAIDAAGLHSVAEDSLCQLFDQVASETIAAIRAEAMTRQSGSRL